MYASWGLRQNRGKIIGIAPGPHARGELALQIAGAPGTSACLLAQVFWGVGRKGFGARGGSEDAARFSSPTDQTRNGRWSGCARARSVARRLFQRKVPARLCAARG